MTTSTDPATSASVTIDVNATVERAFMVFTEQMSSWWDPDHHIIEAPYERMVFEPYVGGAIYDLGTDGSTCEWATVLAYEPPHRVVFSWNINLQWTIETDPAKRSEVEVTFAALPQGGTRVVLTHRELQRHGEGWEGMRDAVASPRGWPALLGRFAAPAGG